MAKRKELEKKLRNRGWTGLKEYITHTTHLGGATVSNQSWKTDKQYLEGNIDALLRQADKRPDVWRTLCEDHGLQTKEDLDIDAARTAISRSNWALLIAGLSLLIALFGDVIVDWVTGAS